MRQDDKTTTRTMTMEEHNAILQEQLSGMVERLAAMEMKLDMEVANRDSLVAQGREKLREEVLSEFEDKVADIKTREEALAKRESALEILTFHLFCNDNSMKKC